MAIPEKYSHINFKPPSGVRREAEFGLKLRREHGRGGTAVGIARGRDLSNGVELSPSTIRRMKAYFDRHDKDQQAPGFSRGDSEWPSNGKIAWLLWGGDSGRSFANKVVKQMNAADEKDEGRSLRPFGSTHGMKPKIFVVHGAPMAGKTSYVDQHKGDNDVVFDFNRVMSALSGQPTHQKNDHLISYCTDIRTLIIDKALRNPKVDKTWIITTKVGDEMKKSLSDVPVEYIHIDTPKEECLRRVSEDPERQPVAEELRQVIERYFGEHDSEEQRRAALPSNVERRFIGNFSHVEKADPELLRVERRADPVTGKPKQYLVGYAARFHKDSLLLGDFVERIDPGAFDIVESRTTADGKPLETRCLYNHDPNHLLGRFPTTMRMSVDEKGLRYECLLPESRSDIAELCERGDLRGSSFSFVVADGGERWSTENGQSIRTVTKIKALLDCGPVTYPAYDSATVEVAKRSYQHFVESEKQSATEVVEARAKREATKAKAVSLSAEMQAFIAERRGFCPTGKGGGVDNSCGSKDSSGRAPTLEQERLGMAGKSASKQASSQPARPKSLEQERLEAAGLWDNTIDPAISSPYDGGGNGGFVNDFHREVVIPGTNGQKSKVNIDDPEQVAQYVTLAARASGMSVEDFIKSKRMNGTMAKFSPEDKAKLFGGSRWMYVSKSKRSGGWGNKELDETAKRIGSTLRAARINPERLADAVREYAKANKLDPKNEMYSGLKTYQRDPREFMEWALKRLEKTGISKRSDDSVDDVDVAGISKELFAFLAERRGGNDCGRDEGGRFGSGNQCASDEDGEEPKASGKSMEWQKGKDAEAQKFIDDARQGQLERGGKDGGKSDDGGGVQTWSKGDDYPWTMKQVGTDEGYIQGQHPDGSKTEQYPFKGDPSDAVSKMRDEIKRRKGQRADRVIAETLAFLKERSGRGI